MDSVMMAASAVFFYTLVGWMVRLQLAMMALRRWGVLNRSITTFSPLFTRDLGWLLPAPIPRDMNSSSDISHPDSSPTCDRSFASLGVFASFSAFLGYYSVGFWRGRGFW